MMLAELGYGNNGRQTFWAYTDGVAGTLSVKINGITATDTVTVDSNHGYCAWLDAKVPGESAYNWQLFIGSTPVTEVRRANAQCVTGRSFKIISIADTVADPFGYWTVRKERPNAIFNVGDFDYTLNGVNFADLASGRLAWYKSVSGCRNRNQLLSTCPNIAAWDNHDGMDAGNASGTNYFPNAAWNTSYQIWLEWVGWKNPRNTDAGINTFPNLYGAGPEKATYHTTVFGDVAIVTMDHISFAANRYDVNLNRITGASGTELTQTNWFIAKLSTITQPVIILNWPTQPKYTAEYRTLLAAVNNIPGKTIVLVTGDSHGTIANYRAQGVSGLPEFSNYGLLEIQAASMQHGTQSCGNTLGYGTNLFGPIALPVVEQNLDPANNLNYLCIDRFSSEGYTEFRIKQAISGATRWGCRINDGSRVPVVI